MAIASKLITAEEFFHLPSRDGKTELVDGEVIEMAPAGGEHGGIASEVLFQLRLLLRESPLGVALTETGFKLKSDPDTVRGPDVAFLEASRLPSGRLPREFIDGPPTIAVEVVSPSDTYKDVLAKVGEYLDAGSKRVWVANPRPQTVTVYYPDGTSRLLRGDEMLSGEDVLPGFEVRAGDLFK